MAVPYSGLSWFELSDHQLVPVRTDKRTASVIDALARLTPKCTLSIAKELSAAAKPSVAARASRLPVAPAIPMPSARQTEWRCSFWRPCAKQLFDDLIFFREQLRVLMAINHHPVGGIPSGRHHLPDILGRGFTEEAVRCGINIHHNWEIRPGRSEEHTSELQS